jgi:hypothetical protein
MATPRTLSDLRDIHLPPPPGDAGLDLLWLLAVALLCVAMLVVWALRRRRQRVLRQSLRELAAAERACAVDGDTAALARTLSRLLRRHAMRRDPGSASLTGGEWLNFLDKHAGAAAGVFADGRGALLADLPYRLAADAAPLAELVQLVKRWLRSNP